jgi:hypothetical protein
MTSAIPRHIVLGLGEMAFKRFRRYEGFCHEVNELAMENPDKVGMFEACPFCSRAEPKTENAYVATEIALRWAVATYGQLEGADDAQRDLAYTVLINQVRPRILYACELIQRKKKP